MTPLKDINADMLLECISQEEVFETYLGMPVQTSYHFISPLRADLKPTCTFKYIDGKLIFRDWAASKSHNVFTFVQQYHNVSFRKALQIIYDKFYKGEADIELIPQEVCKVRQKQKTKKKHIYIEPAEFTELDKSYLSSFGITRKQTNKFKVFRPNRVWLDHVPFYRYNTIDPALAYYFGDAPDGERWKIYFYRRKSGMRFICNTNRIAGWKQLPETADLLIITKSLKDVMLLDRLHIASIAGQSENFMFYDYIIDELKARFKQIYIIYDNDCAGIRLATNLSQKFQIPFLVPPGKDLTDTFKYQGKHVLKQFLHDNNII